MTEQRVLNSYPTIRHAVSWVELFICGVEPEAGESSWDLMMCAYPPLSPGEVAQCIRKATEGETIGNAAQAYAEMFRPEFRTYIAGKMGMM